MLEAQDTKGGISRAAPQGPQSLLHSLPPILSEVPQTPISGCSKGSRGLSVWPRVLGIFTETAISPSPSLRQRPSRYAIRAGRNLPDKEFRSEPYLPRLRCAIRTDDVPCRPAQPTSSPACRHADGTISSSGVPDARRMASEDSDQILPGLAVIHRLGDLRDLDRPAVLRCSPAVIFPKQRANFSKSSCFDVRSGCSRKKGTMHSESSSRLPTMY